MGINANSEHGLSTRLRNDTRGVQKVRLHNDNNGGRKHLGVEGTQGVNLPAVIVPSPLLVMQKMEFHLMFSVHLSFTEIVGHGAGVHLRPYVCVCEG